MDGSANGVKAPRGDSVRFLALVSDVNMVTIAIIFIPIPIRSTGAGSHNLVNNARKRIVDSVIMFTVKMTVEAGSSILLRHVCGVFTLFYLHHTHHDSVGYL